MIKSSTVHPTPLLHDLDPWMAASPIFDPIQRGSDKQARNGQAKNNEINLRCQINQERMSQILLWKQLQEKQNYLQNWNV